jgi:hypothetical protein
MPDRTRRQCAEIEGARARVKIGLANLAYNMRRFVWLLDDVMRPLQPPER